MKSSKQGRFTTKRVITSALSIAAVGGVILGVSGVAGVDAANQHRRDRSQIACISINHGGEQLQTVLTDLVTDGTITSDQQNAIETRISDAKSAADIDCSGMRLMRDRTVGKAVLDLLGMDRLDFRQAWINGQSLAEIAETQGVTRVELVATITSSIDARLNEAVDQGRINEEQKTEILPDLTERIESGIDTRIGDMLDQLQERRDSKHSIPATPASESTSSLVA